MRKITKQQRKELQEFAATLPNVVEKHKHQDVQANHFRRLKRAYQRNGVEGVRHYVAQLDKVANEG